MLSFSSSKAAGEFSWYCCFPKKTRGRMEEIILSLVILLLLIIEVKDDGDKRKD